MATLTEYAAFSLPVSGDQPLAAGRNTNPITLTVTGTADAWMGSLATATNATLWDSSTSPISSFLYAWIKADQDIFIEIQGGSAANNAVRKVKAGFPEILSTGTMRTYSAGGSFGGSSTAITKVLARNESGTTTTVRAFFIL